MHSQNFTCAFLWRQNMLIQSVFRLVRFSHEGYDSRDLAEDGRESTEVCFAPRQDIWRDSR